MHFLSPLIPPSFFIFIFLLHPNNSYSLLANSIPMKSSSSAALLKQEFLKRWIKGLQIYTNFNKDEMTIIERKKAIKLSADVAIASTRNPATHWSQALAAAVSTEGPAAESLVQKILGRKVISSEKLVITCGKKIVRRSCRRIRVVRSSHVKAAWIANKLVRNRTRVLKKLVPGGQQMDDVSLIKETLDYITSLQLQVDVMRHLAAAAQTLDPNQRFS